MDVFGKIVAIFAGIILLFIAPLFYMAQKQDSISQLCVAQETTRLTDTIRMSGVLTLTMYKDYIKRIDKTGNLYFLLWIVMKKFLLPWSCYGLQL